MKLTEGNGMGSSCKYSYLSGACANRHVDSLQCIGEDRCEFAGLNVMTAKGQRRRAGVPAVTKNWLGLYCETHRRFHCPGSEDCLGMANKLEHAGLKGLHTSEREEL